MSFPKISTVNGVEAFFLSGILKLTTSSDRHHGLRRHSLQLLFRPSRGHGSPPEGVRRHITLTPSRTEGGKGTHG